MKKWIPVLLALALRTTLYSIEIEVRNVADDYSNPTIDFGGLASNLKHHFAKQYLGLSYPVDDIDRVIRLYTDNADVPGQPGSECGGLVSTQTFDCIPMYWTHFSTVQQVGTINFTPENFPEWKPVIEILEPLFETKKDLAIVPKSGNGLSFFYFGAIVSTATPKGDYKTKLVVEVVNRVSDLGAPVIVDCPFFTTVHFSRKPFVFRAKIEDDVQVREAKLFFRFSGENSFSVSTMTLSLNPENPFQWFAESSIPPERVNLGTMQYFIETTDGFNSSSFGTASAPNQTQVIGEFAEVISQISPGGGTVRIFEGDPRFGSTALSVPPGTTNGSLDVATRKVNPVSHPTLNGETPTELVEFRPLAPANFNARPTLSIRYDDENGDGIVDGTNILVKDLKIYWWDNFEWRIVGGKVDETRRVVEAPISHLSEFGLFSGQPTVADFRPREKIITPARFDGRNDFASFDGLDGLGEFFTIEIFDMSGRKIRSLNQLAQWDGRDNDGNLVESGVYLYQVHAQGKVVTGLITVAK